jgi:hypothetical protein
MIVMSKFLYLILLILISFSLITCLPSSMVKIKSVSASPPVDTFSIIQLSDTQYLSESYPELFNNLTRWVADNSLNYNLLMVIHTGDIVDNSSQSYQWENANSSMSILSNANIPYCWVAGNHDQYNHNQNAAWPGTQYPTFNGSCMRSKTYWVDDYDSKNTVVQFSFGVYSFLIINIEYYANSSVLTWMKELLSKSSGSNVILTTHSYLNDTGGYGFNGNYAWETSFRSILDSYSNIFLTLSGHDPWGKGANMTKVGNREEVFFDRQSMDNLTGAASARIYTFNITSMQVAVKTYIVYAQDFLTDPYNQFYFDVKLSSDNLKNIFPFSYFWVGPSYQSHISFSNNSATTQTSQIGSVWAFTNLTLNDVTSNLTATTSGANMVISNYDPDGWLNYTVSGIGTQTIYSLKKPPAAVYIDGIQNSSCWNYSYGSVTIAGASSSVAINFTEPAVIPTPSNIILPSNIPSTTETPTPSPASTPVLFPSPSSVSISSPNLNPTPTLMPETIFSPSISVSLTGNPHNSSVISISYLLIGIAVALSIALIFGTYLTLKRRNKQRNQS